MTSLNSVLEEIQRFWKDEPIFSDIGSSKKLAELEKERNITFPSELQDYIRNIIPHQVMYFETVGNPIRLLTAEEISWNKRINWHSSSS